MTTLLQESVRTPQQPASPSPVPVTPRPRTRQLPSGLLRWRNRFLRQPLVTKIAGANAVIVIVAFAVAVMGRREVGDERRLLVLVALALGLSLLVSVVLVAVALRPIQDLHRTTLKIWSGDLDARVPYSVLADLEIRRVGSALNALLDDLMSDQARIRNLAAQVISAGDRERAQVARELHESTAQLLAGLLAELSVVARENSDAAIAPRLDRSRVLARDILEEVKLLASSMYPRVLDDLGLAAALRYLAREATSEDGPGIHADVDPSCDVASAEARSVLYRVAQESVNNALRHGNAQRITIRLQRLRDGVRLEVEDDGCGFDVAEADRRRPGMGLFTIRERSALIGAVPSISSAVGRGTRISVALPDRTHNAGDDDREGRTS